MASRKVASYAILTKTKLPRLEVASTTRQYKQVKDLKKENLRDHMTNMELVLNMLAEATTTEISKQKLPQGFEESRVIARQGGTIAGDTRKAIEAKSGKPIVTAKNAKRLK